MTQEKPPAPKKFRDDPRVKVLGGDIEKAIRQLRQRTQRAGVLKGLKFRRWYPTTKARARAKRARASREAQRINKIRAIYYDR